MLRQFHERHLGICRVALEEFIALNEKRHQDLNVVWPVQVLPGQNKGGWGWGSRDLQLSL
jgi:uncharacterized protein (DUF2237 family)